MKDWWCAFCLPDAEILYTSSEWDDEAVALLKQVFRDAIGSNCSSMALQLVNPQRVNCPKHVVQQTHRASWVVYSYHR